LALAINQFVVDQLNLLHAQGEDTLNLLVNLLIGYLAASDKMIMGYILRRHNDYNHGILVDAKTLMCLQYWVSVECSDACIVALKSNVVMLCAASNKSQGEMANNKAKSTPNVADSSKGCEAMLSG
jgi:hypothetical protein